MTFLGSRLTGLLAGLSVLALCVFAAGSARALSPVAPSAKAEIVYANGGRILSIEADGSRRKVLTHGSRLAQFEPYSRLGDSDPQISPDGDRLLFTRLADRGRGGPVKKFLVAERDGFRATVIRQDNRRGAGIASPSWSPDSKEIVFATAERKGRMITSTVVAVGLEGGTRTIARLKPTRIGNLGVIRRGDTNGPRVFDNPVISPDGKSLLVGVREITGQRPRLEVIDLITGKRRLLSENATEGSWSPDGDRVVMSVLDPVNPEKCGGICFPAGTNIATIGADGSDRRMLFRSPGNDADPDWSADGTRIAFSSSRNYPSGSFSREIYTITTEGACLTWLTNGSPESQSPSWSPDALASTDPGSCGAGEREASIEGIPRARKHALPGSQLWAGPQVGPMIFTSGETLRFGSFIEYGDCAMFESRDCASEISMGSFSQCAAGIAGASLFGETGKFRTKSWKGHPYWSYRLGRKIQVDMSMAEGAAVYGMTGVPGGRASNRRVLSSLTTLGTDRRVKLSTRPSLPVKAIRRLRDVTRTFDRTGDASATAVALGISLRAVRIALRAERVIARFGKPKALKCPQVRRNGSEGESDGSSGRALDLKGLIR